MAQGQAAGEPPSRARAPFGALWLHTSRRRDGKWARDGLQGGQGSRWLSAQLRAPLQSAWTACRAGRVPLLACGTSGTWVGDKDLSPLQPQQRRLWTRLWSRKTFAKVERGSGPCCPRPAVA